MHGSEFGPCGCSTGACRLGRPHDPVEFVEVEHVPAPPRSARDSLAAQVVSGRRLAQRLDHERKSSRYEPYDGTTRRGR